MYEVIVPFADIYDGGHIYNAGDKYPRDGVAVSDGRAEELLSNKNKIGTPVIKKIQEEVKTEEKPKQKTRKTDK